MTIPCVARITKTYFLKDYNNLFVMTVDCLQMFRSLKDYKKLYCYDCPWLNVNDTEFNNNIIKLVKIQQWVKKNIVK